MPENFLLFSTLALVIKVSEKERSFFSKKDTSIKNCQEKMFAAFQSHILT